MDATLLERFALRAFGVYIKVYLSRKGKFPEILRDLTGQGWNGVEAAEPVRSESHLPGNRNFRKISPTNDADLTGSCASLRTCQVQKIFGNFSPLKAAGQVGCGSGSLGFFQKALQHPGHAATVAGRNRHSKSIAREMAVEQNAPIVGNKEQHFA